MEYKSLSIRHVFTVIIRRKYIIIITLLASLLIALFINLYLYTPLYEVTTSMIIGKGNNESLDINEYNEIIMYQSLLKTYTEIASMDIVIQSTINKIGYNISSEEILNSITIITQNNSQVVTIKVKRPSSEEALALAEAYNRAFIEQCDKIFLSASIILLDKPKLPKQPIGKSRFIIALESIILGILFDIMILVYLEAKDDYIRDEKDLEKILSTNILGRLKTDRNIEQLKMVLNNIRYICQKSDIKAIAIISTKRGNGKTFVISSLAKLMSKYKKRVVLVDLAIKNPRLTADFSLKDKEGIINYLDYANENNLIKKESIIYKSSIELLDIVPFGNINNCFFEFLDEEKLKAFFDYLKESYDYIFIDTSSIKEKSETQAVSKLCDGCIILEGLNKVKKIDICFEKALLKNVGAKLIGIISI